MRRSGVSFALFVLVGAVGLFAAAEIGLRLLTDANSKWNIRLGANKQHDPVVGFRNKPHYDYGRGFVANEYGYLAPEDLRFERPEDAIRIIYLGDSNTVTPRYTHYPVVVEEKAETELGQDVETVNTAVPGFSSFNARLLFETEVSRFDADHFVIYLGWNDLGQYGPEGLPDKRREQGYELSAFQKLLSNLYSIRFVFALQAVSQRSSPGFFEPLSDEEHRLYTEYEPTHFTRNLRAILKRAQSRYPNVYLATIATLTNLDPTPEELATAHFPLGMGKNMKKLHMLVMKYDEAVRTVAGEFDVDVLDFHAAFDSREARTEFTDSCHMNSEGAKRLADLVTAAIVANERRAPSLPRDRRRASSES